jgi:hypothetical protein
MTARLVPVRHTGLVPHGIIYGAAVWPRLLHRVAGPAHRDRGPPGTVFLGAPEISAVVDPHTSMIALGPG